MESIKDVIDGLDTRVGLNEFSRLQNVYLINDETVWFTKLEMTLKRKRINYKSEREKKKRIVTTRFKNSDCLSCEV